MLSAKLKAEVDAFQSRLWQTTPLFKRALDGTADARMIGRYLVNILFLIRHTPVYLRLARDTARLRGDEKLAEFYDAKLSDEDGHDQWALDDLAVLGRRAENSDSEIAPAMIALVTDLRRVIQDDPTLYLGYIFFAEYLTVVIGPPWIEALEDRCGIPSSAMSVIGKHAELDQQHVLHDLKAMAELVRPEQEEPMLTGLARYMAHYERFGAEVGVVTSLQPINANSQASAINLV